MEAFLTQQARQGDEDTLARIAQRWINTLDQDGAEPSEDELQATQGVFLRGKRRGLHRLDIAATDEQFETLITVMNAAANPRAGRPADEDGQLEDPGAAEEALPDPRTRAQKLLDGLVAGARAALSTDVLPAAGGNRPQILAIIDYQELLAELKIAAGEIPCGNGLGVAGTQLFSTAMFASPARSAQRRSGK